MQTLEFSVRNVALIVSDRLHQEASDVTALHVIVMSATEKLPAQMQLACMHLTPYNQECVMNKIRDYCCCSVTVASW